MKRNVSEPIWLDEHGVCSAQHLADMSGLTNEELGELIESGVILPFDDTALSMSFQLRYIVTANIARRLRDDFELDRTGVALAMTLIRRIDELQAELDVMRARFL